MSRLPVRNKKYNASSVRLLLFVRNVPRLLESIGPDDLGGICVCTCKETESWSYKIAICQQEGYLPLNGAPKIEIVLAR